MGVRNAPSSDTHYRDDALRPASPRVPQHLLTRHPGSTLPPAPHTLDEIRALVPMLHTAGASTISIGRGRHPTSAATADALACAWARAGGTVSTPWTGPNRRRPG